MLLEKLSGSQLVKKLPSSYGTRRFITVFISACHLSLSWARSSSPCPPSHFLKIHLNIILPSSPGSSKWSLSFWFFHRLCQRISLSPGHMYLFRKKPRFYGEELLAPCPTPKLGDLSLSAVRDCLFNTLAVRPTLHIEGSSSIRNLRTHHAVVTVTQLSWASCDNDDIVSTRREAIAIVSYCVREPVCQRRYSHIVIYSYSCCISCCVQC